MKDIYPPKKYGIELFLSDMLINLKVSNLTLAWIIVLLELF